MKKIFKLLLVLIVSSAAMSFTADTSNINLSPDCTPWSDMDENGISCRCCYDSEGFCVWECSELSPQPDGSECADDLAIAMAEQLNSENPPAIHSDTPNEGDLMDAKAEYLMNHTDIVNPNAVIALIDNAGEIAIGHAYIVKPITPVLLGAFDLATETWEAPTPSLMGREYMTCECKEYLGGCGNEWTTEYATFTQCSSCGGTAIIPIDIDIDPGDPIIVPLPHEGTCYSIGIH